MRKIVVRFVSGAFLFAFPFLTSSLNGQPQDFPETKFPITDGPVFTAVETNGILYIGGNFRQVGPLSGGICAVSPSSGAAITPFPYLWGAIKTTVMDSQGGVWCGGAFKDTQGLGITNLARLMASGLLDTNQQFAVDDQINALAIYGNQVVLAGRFSHVNGMLRNHLAIVAPDTGMVTDFNLGTDGEILAIAVSGDTLFVAGKFNQIGGVPRINLASVDLLTRSVTSWDPSPDSTFSIGVQLLATDGDRLYASGDFTHISGVSRQSLAAFDLTTGQLLAWAPQVSGTSTNYPFPLNALAVSGSNVYIGGGFANVNGQSRNALGAVDRDTGALLPWSPGVPLNNVLALAVSNTTVFVGGDFPQIGTNGPARLAAVDAGSGSVLNWAPLPGGAVYTLLPAADKLFVGGDFNLMGGALRNFLAAVDASSGSILPWNARISGVSASSGVRTLALRGTNLYLAGNFSAISNQTRYSLGAVRAADGGVLPFAPQFQGAFWPSINGMWFAGSNIFVAGFLPSGSPTVVDATNGIRQTWNLNANGALNSFAAVGQTFFVGGAFTQISGQARKFLVAYDANSRALLPWPATVDATVTSLFSRDQTVVALGNFHTGNGAPASGIAVFDGVSGHLAPGPTNLTINGQIRDLRPTGNAFYVAGDFTSINGAPRNYFAGLDLLTGAPQTWSPAIAPGASGGAVGYAAVPVTGQLVVGGSFSGCAGTSRSYVATFPISNSPSVVSLTSPTNNTIVTPDTQLPLTVSASGDIVSLEVFARNLPVLISSNSSIASTWVAPNHVGDYLLTTVGFDAFGNSTFSSAARLSVVLPAGYIPPSIAISSPSNNFIYGPEQQLAIQTSVSTPSVAPEFIQFFLNSSLFATVTNPPYSVALTNLSPGTNSVRVVLQDRYGTLASNGPVTFRINKAPTISMTGPPDGYVIKSGGLINFVATATDTDGSIRDLGFWYGTHLVAAVTNVPYYTWTNVPGGVYRFYAVATDNFGTTSTSRVAKVTVVPKSPSLRMFANSASAWSMELTAEPDLAMDVETSTNLSNWDLLTTVTTGAGATNFSLPESADPKRFYRAKWSPQ
jgi:hypothetical protein